MEGYTYGDEGMDEDQRRWKESWERENVARDEVGGQSVRQTSGMVGERGVEQKTKGLYFSWN